MNSQVIALMCTLITAACGSSGTRPAQDVTSDATVDTNPQSNADITPRSDVATSQPVSHAADNSFETTSTSTEKSTGVNPYVPANTAPTKAEATSGLATTPNPENTKTNVRDRQDTLTPMDQGNSAAETKITASIRKGIMGDKAISFTGKNVKIITIGTKVTLRGPVKNDKERSAIEGIAKRTAGVSAVDNQLEVSN